jgi:acetyltransferase-like isoleucine patch superfamily enzyme
MTIPELHGRIRFWRTADRIGPDIPWTHWRLHFKSLMTALCRSKLAAFGEGAEIRPGAYVVLCSRVSLGRRVVIRPGTIIIEDDVMLGSGVQIYVDKHRFDDVTMPIIDQGEHPAEAVRLARGCWIGANAIILPGVTVGENAVVGAGSIVTRDVPARTLVAGSPARVIRAIGNSSTS